MLSSPSTGSLLLSKHVTKLPSPRLDLPKSRLTAFRRSLSDKSRNFAMHVASGLPDRMKELLAKRCQEQGMADFATTILSQELLVDSDGHLEEEDVVTEAAGIWADSDDTLVEATPSPLPSSDKPSLVDKTPTAPARSSRSITVLPPDDCPAFAAVHGKAFNASDGQILDPPSPYPESPLLQSPFSDDYAVEFESDYAWSHGQDVATKWDPSITSTPVISAPLDGLQHHQTLYGRESFSLNMDLGSSIFVEGDNACTAQARCAAGPGAGLPGYGEDPFQDYVSELGPGDDSQEVENFFISPGADLESYLGFCYPDPCVARETEVRVVTTKRD